MNLSIFYLFFTIILQLCFFIFLQLKVKKSNYFNFCFFWFNIFFLLIPLFVQYTNRQYPWGGIYNDNLIIYSLLLLSFFSLSYVFGYLIKINFLVKEIKIRYTTKLVGFYILLFLFNIFLGIFLIKNTFYRIYILPRGFIYQFTSSFIMLYLISKFIWVFLLILNYYVLFEKKILFKLLFGVNLVFVLMIMNPISNPRFIYLGVLIGLGFMFFKWKCFGNLKKSFLLLFVFFYTEVAILPIAKNLLFYISNKDFLIDQLIRPNLNYFLRVNFDAYQQYLNTVELIKTTGSYDYFYRFISALLFFIPRSIWPEKAINTGEIIANFKNYDYTNLSEPLIANLYYSGGLLGILFGGIFLGTLFRQLDYHLYQYVFYNKKTINSMLSVLLTGYVIIFLRGAFNATFPMYGIEVYLIILLYFINKLTVKGEK